jgi:lipopolysaccharide biosynthesis regulator YciM
VALVLLLLALVALGGWWVGRGSVPNYAARVDSLVSVADSLRGVAGRQRAATDTVVLRLREAGHRAADANLALGNALDTARYALATDSSPKALRMALSDVVAQAERYQAEVLTYQAHVDTLVKAHLAERQATAQQVDALQAVVDEQARALEAGRCSTFFGPCPTRWQSFALGGLVAAVVLALL